MSVDTAAAVGSAGARHGDRMRRSGRVALAAAVAFGLIALASAQGRLLAGDELLLRGLLPLRTCLGLTVSQIVTRATAIETVAVLTALSIVVVGLAGAGLRAVWLGAWALTLPLELVLKLSVAHPFPANVLGASAPSCEPGSGWGASPLGVVLTPLAGPVMNVEAVVVQPALGVAIGHTFPSGSVLRLTFFTLLVAAWVVVHAGGGWRALALAVLGAVALLGAVAPLVLLWHWPSDVVGGAVLGVMLACVAGLGLYRRPTRPLG